MIYTRLPAGGTYYPICMFATNSECLIGIYDAFYAFCLRVSVIFPTCPLYPQPKRAYSALHAQARTDIIIQVHACRHLTSAVPWNSEDRLLSRLVIICVSVQIHCMCTLSVLYTLAVSEADYKTGHTSNVSF